MTSSDRPAQALRALLIAQFCGAFNDNAWKLIVALLAIRQVALDVGDLGSAFETASQIQTTLTFVVFTLPLMLGSVVAGVLSDRFSKRTVIIGMKALEVGLMTAGTVALFLDPVGGLLPLVVLAGMGVQSALFSPAKYGILPEILPHERLSSGNGALELWTFAAIIMGTAAGGILLGMTGAQPWLAGVGLMGLTIVGLAASLGIPDVPPARTDGGIRVTVTSAWKAVRADQVLGFGILGGIVFWTIASLVGQDIIIYGKSVLGLTDATTGLPLAAFGIGIGLGSVLAGTLSGAKVEFGLIPLGALGLSVGLLFLGIVEPGFAGTLLAMMFLGIASGFIVVPINALIQWRSPADRRGGVIALSNTAVFTGVLVGSLGAGFLAVVGLDAGNILVVAGALTLAMTMWSFSLIPASFLRLALTILTMTVYRLHVGGVGHVPVKGPALLIPNHVSFIEGLLILASVDRPVRFLVDRYYYEHSLFHRLACLMGAIPISSSGTTREVIESFRQARRCLDAGELVCLFPEGYRTRNGKFFPFRRGYERLVQGRDIPIIPVHLDRVWGSMFSFVGERFLLKWPERFPYHITVSFGAPLSSRTSAQEVREKIQELTEAAWQFRKTTGKTLHHSFVWAMRRHPFRMAFGDVTRPKVSCLEALVGVIALARALRPHWGGQHTVGILLPPSVGGALVNVAATLSGRTTVNLNYTAGKEGMESAAKQASLMTIVTSRRFVQKAKLEVPESATTLWLEDIRPTIGPVDKLVALLLAIGAPVALVERMVGAICRPTMDDLATIIFSSGSTGEPKGVMLTQFNLESNVQGVAHVLSVERRDRLLGILPFFHSFGYLATLWFPAIHGVGVVYHPSPLDTGAIGELVHKNQITILLTTPTFLQLYSRRCQPEQFASLRILLTGAEKLPDRLIQACEKRFGIVPIEGYGVTECSPVIALNCPDYRAAGYFQPGTRQGTVGRPLPGIAVKVVDPETWAPLPISTPGMLLVKGPNVMPGYLGREDLTSQSLRDGWYITGDIGAVDEDGFITITDRLSRFSKIGGEMVPHGKVEAALHQAAGADTQVFAVTGIPDDQKGEQLVVLHTLEEEAIPEILANLTESGLPNLFFPRKDRFLRVRELPVLGSGKLDLRTVKRLALERLGHLRTQAHKEGKDH